METILKKAVVTGRPVVVMYLSKKGLVTKRMVTVQKLTGTYIDGYCHLRNDTRRFLLESILAVLPASNEEISALRNIRPYKSSYEN